MSDAKRYVLLDRDGTILVERNYLARVEDVELLPGAAAGLCAMQAMGLGLIIVSNQSGIGRGYFSLDTLNSIHARMEELLGAEGVTIDKIYVCPHRPDEDCACRKPLTGMVDRAAQEMGFAPSNAFMIGDKDVDTQLGMAIGAVTFLVATGYGQSYRDTIPYHHFVETLSDAAAIIQQQLLENA